MLAARKASNILFHLSLPSMTMEESNIRFFRLASYTIYRVRLAMCCNRTVYKWAYSALNAKVNGQRHSRELS
jgi:hypothetical protein